MNPSLWADPPTGIDWPHLLDLAARKGIRVWRTTGVGEVVPVTTPPKENR